MASAAAFFLSSSSPSLYALSGRTHRASFSIRPVSVRAFSASLDYSAVSVPEKSSTPLK
ncbi:hypothetical protein CRG98_016435, partial [Punica granatum]